MFHPHHVRRIARRWLRHVWPFQRSTASMQLLPVPILMVPYRAALRRLPLMATSAVSPTGDQQARKGGVSVRIVASLNKTTVRSRSFSPRWSPLLTAATSRGAGPIGAAAASDGSRGVRSPGRPAGAVSLVAAGPTRADRGGGATAARRVETSGGPWRRGYPRVFGRGGSGPRPRFVRSFRLPRGCEGEAVRGRD